MKLKKLILAMVLAPLMALADTEVVDGIEWTYRLIGNAAEVGTGAWWNPAIPLVDDRGHHDSFHAWRQVRDEHWA